MLDVADIYFYVGAHHRWASTLKIVSAVSDIHSWAQSGMERWIDFNNIDQYFWLIFIDVIDTIS
jgi:hypothetical protein